MSETVRTLTELRHTPASPSFLRKATTCQQQQQQSNPLSSSSKSASETCSINNTSAPSGVGHNFMAVLSSKLMGSASSAGGSPKSTRKHITHQELQLQATSNGNPRTPTGFLETLNAKLAHQQPQQQHQQQDVSTFGVARLNSVNRSASIRGIMASRLPIIDPLQVRDSLMDQIRRGTLLRKTNGPINDRSAPQIY